MTRDEIMNMPAGREMNVLIAEKAMKWKQVIYQNEPWWGDTNNVVCVRRDDWRPSGNIAHAWLAVRRIQEELDPCAIVKISNGDCDSMDVDIIVDDLSNLQNVHITIEDGTFSDAPLAICRATLLAVTS